MKAIGNNTETFLRSVISYPANQEGFLLIAFGDGANWQELWFRWPDQVDEAVERALELAPEYNVYFSSYLFRTPCSTKDNVLEGTRTIQADLDDADVESLPLQPTILVRTSPNRHQGYWVLTSAQSLEEHERLSRLITYSIAKCDHSGWPLGRKVRLAGTINHKYATPHEVGVINQSGVLVDPDDIMYLTPIVPTTVEAIANDEWVDGEHPCETHGKEILFSIKQNVTAKLYDGYDILQADRSLYLWNLMRACFRAGLDRDQVFCVAAWSVNNKFRDLTVNAERELAKDVQRAFESVQSNELDYVSIINSARQASGIKAVKNQRISAAVLQYMSDQGRFLRTQDDQSWYIDNTQGRPIPLVRGSSHLRHLLDYRFGLNGSEIEYSYVADHLETHASRMAPTAISTALSYYHHASRTLYLHLGGRDVAKITATARDVVPNGTDNIVFPWIKGVPALRLDSRELPTNIPWDEVMFGEGSFQYAENVNEAEGIALLRVWLMFVLMRHAAPSRPILALLGPPASGKSTLLKKVYKLLYGDAKDVLIPNDPKEFDQSVGNNPLVALDNQDGPVATWLLNALAGAAGTSDIERRALFTNNETFTLKRQALIAISAHEPRFGRGDIADRMMIVNLKRRPDAEFVDERQIFGNILSLRGRIWNAIIADLQRVLAHPLPNPADVPHTRIQDFATTGYWIASALGVGQTFKQVIERVNGSQKSFALQDDDLLEAALDKYITKHHKTVGTFINPGMLWTVLESHSSDPVAFKRQYRNAMELARRLSTLTEALRAQYDIDNEVDPVKGTKLWSIQERRNGHAHSEN